MSKSATEEKLDTQVEKSIERQSTSNHSGVVVETSVGNSFSKLKKLVGISGLVMSVALPIGIVPRVFNAQEL